MQNYLSLARHMIAKELSMAITHQCIMHHLTKAMIHCRNKTNFNNEQNGSYGKTIYEVAAIN